MGFCGVTGSWQWRWLQQRWWQVTMTAVTRPTPPWPPQCLQMMTMRTSQRWWDNPPMTTEHQCDDEGHHSNQCDDNERPPPMTHHHQHDYNSMTPPPPPPTKMMMELGGRPPSPPPTLPQQHVIDDATCRANAMRTRGLQWRWRTSMATTTTTMELEDSYPLHPLPCHSNTSSTSPCQQGEDNDNATCMANAMTMVTQPIPPWLPPRSRNDRRHNVQADQCAKHFHTLISLHLVLMTCTLHPTEAHQWWHSWQACVVLMVCTLQHTEAHWRGGLGTI